MARRRKQQGLSKAQRRWLHVAILLVCCGVPWLVDIPQPAAPGQMPVK